MQHLRRLAVFAPVLVALSGCSQGPRTFRLVPSPQGPVLIPPGVRNATVANASLPLRKNHGRSTCEPSPGGLRFNGRAIVITRDALTRASADELIRWTATLESNGCISDSQAANLHTSILNTLPLEVSSRKRLRGELSATQGAFDLTAHTSLRVVSPVFRPGAAPGKAIAGAGNVSAGANGSIEVELKANPDLVGYEVAWYDVQDREREAGVRIVPRSAETHIAGTVTASPSPIVNHLAIEPSARWFRYFVMTRASRNDYNILVLAGSTRPELEARSELFRRDAAGYLEKAPASSYAAMTSEIGVNPYLRVKVNGVASDVAIGSSVSQAIDQVAARAGASQTAAKLSVLKPHARGMTQVDAAHKQELLNLPLEGGEEISWQ